ncbi:MAG TPA: hypothetical protein VF699_02545, partial [Caulobacteraceae bacterium]
KRSLITEFRPPPVVSRLVPSSGETVSPVNLSNCLYGAFQCQADFTSPISYTVVREQLLVARRPTVIG